MNQEELMKNKLTLKELSPYLNTDLKVKDDSIEGTYRILSIHNHDDSITLGIKQSSRFHKSHESFIYEIKPILFPLSWLGKLHEKHACVELTNEYVEKLGYDNEYKISFYYEGRYFYVYRNGIHCVCAQGNMLDKLFEWKFNVFNLPEELYVKVTDEFNPYK